MTIKKTELGNATWLIEKLPVVKPIKRKCEADYYGASALIAKSLGLDKVPESLASWNHGIAFWREPVLPRQVVLTATQLDRCLVFNKQQEIFLRRKGFLRAHAVGAPILYVPKMRVSRIKKSLLVMPSHTLFNTNPNMPFDEYAQSISSYYSEFETIVACIHINDVRKGYWPAAFEKVNIPWVAGADSHDGNALVRVACLFSLFEFMTANALGSHIPYATYFGCKPSVAGPIAEHKTSDFHGVPWYDRNRKALHYGRISKEKYLKGPRNPDFFVEPTQAKIHLRFAEQALGVDCRKSPEEVANLLGWNKAGQAELRIRRTLRQSLNRSVSIIRRLRKKR